MIKRLTAALTALSFLFCLFASPAYADNYSDYRKNHPEQSASVPEIRIAGGAFSSASEEAKAVNNSNYEGKENVLVRENDQGTVNYTFEAKQSGNYQAKITYRAFSDKTRELEVGLFIDGIQPFDESGAIILPKIWKYKDSIRQDKRGNDLLPQKEQVEDWQSVVLTDSTGTFCQPFEFFIEEGMHTLSLSGIRGTMAVSEIRFFSPESPISYSEYMSRHKNAPEITVDPVKVQGESPSFMSDSSINPITDRSSAATQNSDAARLKLNTIGGYTWKTAGQKITWILDVPQSGMYSLGLKARQNTVRGQASFRRLEIDGAVPFSEAEIITFPFDSKWQMIVPKSDGQPQLFYLEKGAREISLEATFGPLSETVAALEGNLFEINELYRKIIMITGPEPDPYTDYFLEKDIPNLLEDFERLKDSFAAVKRDIEQTSGQKSTDAAILETLSVQLDGFIKKPESIQTRITSFKDNISALSSYVIKIKEQPLEIDFITAAPNSSQFESVKAGFFTAFSYRIKSFFSSFFNDYNLIGDKASSGESLSVWVGLGRDQAQVIKQLIDDQFTPEYEISVNVGLVQQGLIQATLAGEGPDIALFVGAGDPVNLAARGALYDLSQFDDFSDIKSRFSKNAYIPYEYENGTYALPVTESFYMMFYRTDIFKALNIKKPDTWQELYDIIPIIQRKNMQIGLPAVAVNPGAASMANNVIFQTLLYQMGGQCYNESRTKTVYDSKEALQAFKQWTDYYSKYSFPLEYDFYSRFRTGEMPIAIDGYTMYNKLNVATPELKGLWEMTVIPATVREDGSLDRTAIASGTSAVLFNKTKNKDDAWTFLKWWTDAETQTEYGYSIEALMGASARYDTANTEAFKNLPWKRNESVQLMSQWESTVTIPQIPASYYEFRSIYNAFRKVVFSGGNARETLFKYNNDINKEITRKREEFGL